ncbi:MAG: helix-turn-helix transcriptional regulator [Tannerella sp.]|jgi:DNA-binding CsgD family transcriptional regulator|nr:helix-turn-helix transcriptional regulator [Tannerella sp.]
MLTKREHQVLGLVAVGLTPDEIGDRLYISRETARKTICNIKCKLGFGKAAELAAYFWCQFFGASFEEQKRRVMAACLLMIFLGSIGHVDMFARRTRVRRSENLIENICEP